MRTQRVASRSFVCAEPLQRLPEAPAADELTAAARATKAAEKAFTAAQQTVVTADRQIERVFDALRESGLADDTLVVVVGDHGQAFGFPHDSYIQGRTVYEEDVHVPLLIWWPRRYAAPQRVPLVGGHVDLARQRFGRLR